MSSRRWMRGERAYVANVDQSCKQLQRVEKARTALAPLAGRPLEPEGQQAGSLARQIFLHEAVIRMSLQARVIDPCNLVVLLQVLRDLKRAVADPVHP